MILSKSKILIAVAAGAALIANPVSAQNKMKADTLHFKQMKDVEVTMEVPAQKGNTFYIVNSSRNIDIKTWSENKVKVVSTVSVEADAKAGSGMEMFEKAGITLRSLSNRVELNARGSGNSTYTLGTFVNGINGTNIIKDGNVYYSEIDALSPTKVSGSHITSLLSGNQVKRRTMTIYVPEGVKLDVDSRSSDIILRDNYKQAKFNIAHSNLDGQNIDELSLIAKYSMVNLGDLSDAQVEFENGTLRAISIKQLDIDSKSSTIEYENGDNIYFRSQRDNYAIESIKKIEGRKQYGELRIDKLHNLLDIEGNNADVKIRNIMDEVEKIKLSNNYADVRLPIRNLENYSVAFEGNFSTVFAPFEKTIVKQDKKETEEKADKEKADKEKLEALVTTPGRGARGGTFYESATSVYGYRTSSGPIAPSKFTASMGNAAGKKTKFELVCHSCTIDFK